MESTADLIKEELVPVCSCGKLKAIFFCNQKVFCNSGQGLYCMTCMDEHEHKAIRTIKQFNEEIQKWVEL